MSELTVLELYHGCDINNGPLNVSVPISKDGRPHLQKIMNKVVFILRLHEAT